MELQELSICSDGALSPIQSPPWNYQAIFDQSENSPYPDIPSSTQVTCNSILLILTYLQVHNASNL
jgi:hypothetical protein